MDGPNDQFARICDVPEAFRRGPDSLRDVVRASGFAELRGRLSAQALADYLRARPAVVARWVAYSEDKRTSEGWYLRAPAAVGRLTRELPPAPEQQYADPAAACAAFILAELGDILDRMPAV